MKKIQFVVLLIGTVLLIGCGSTESNENTNSLAYKLEVSTDKVFPLDNETAFDGIKGKYIEIDNKGYYTFYNRENHSLYFYDYQSSELEHVTKMDKEGPNAVKAPYFYLGFHVQDFDNIFINTIKFFYRINRDGEVLNKYDQTGDFFSKVNFNEDEATVYKNDKLYMGIKMNVPAKGDTNFLRAIFNMKTNTIEEKYVDERLIVPDYEAKRDKTEEMSKSGGVSSVSIDFVGDDEWLVSGTSVGDSLYFFKDFKLTGVYYAGDPEVEVTNFDGYFDRMYTEQLSGGGIRIGPRTEQPAFFTHLFLSPDRKKVYRIFIHGTKGVIPEGGTVEQPKLISASLIVFDVATKTSTHLPLPIEELNMSYSSDDILVTPDGMLFPVKDMESESEKVYKVLKVKSSNE